MACRGMIFTKNLNFLDFVKFFFLLLHLIFSSYSCFIDLKRQSEHSGLHPDTSSLVFFSKSYDDAFSMSSGICFLISVLIFMQYKVFVILN